MQSVSFATLRVKPLRDLRSISAAAKHNSREFSTPNIDKSRSHMNRVLQGGGSFREDFSASRFGKMKTFREGGNLAAEMVLTARADWFSEIYPGWQKDPEKLRPWVDATDRFLREKYGEGYISGVLHLDEESPHIHCMIVPSVKYIRKLNGQSYEFERISYHSQFGDDKWVFAKARQEQNPELTKLGKLQTEYAQSVSHLGLVRGRNSYTQKPRKHITTHEYQAEKSLLNEKIAGDFVPVQPVKMEIPEVGIGSVFQLKKISVELKAAQEKLNAEIQKQNSRREEIIDALAIGERRKKLLSEEQNRSAEIADLLRAHQKRARGIGIDLLAEVMHFSPWEKAMALDFKKEKPRSNSVDLLARVRNLPAKTALDELTFACIYYDIQRAGDVLLNENSSTFSLLSEYRQQAEKEALRKIREEKLIVSQQIREEQARKQQKMDEEKVREAVRRAGIERQAAVLAAQMAKYSGGEARRGRGRGPSPG